jgi:hypothetical protein
MRKHVDVIVSLVAAVAVVAVVPAIVHGLEARVLFVFLLLALTSTIPMYFARQRKHASPVTGSNNLPASVPTIIGIAAYDQATAIGNETNITVNPPNASRAHERSEDEPADE